MEKIGGMSGMMGMLPGIGKIKKQMDAANFDDSIFKRQRAIISSMTPKERRSPKILDGKRKRRIASGSGTKPEDINKLLKMHRQMADMMKTMGKRGGLMQRMMGGGAGGPSPAELERMQAELGRLDPKALENLPKDLKEHLPKGLPGLGGGSMPKLPGLPGLGGGAPQLSGSARFAGQEEISRNPSITTFEHQQRNDSMSVKIRLSRGGTKKRPYYYIVVAESASPRDGRYIEQIGTHNPLLPKDNADRVKLDVERAKHWLAVGAQPSDRVSRFLDAAGLMKREGRNEPAEGQAEEEAPGA